VSIFSISLGGATVAVLLWLLIRISKDSGKSEIIAKIEREKNDAVIEKNIRDSINNSDPDWLNRMRDKKD